MAWTPLTSAGLQTRLSQDEFNALLDECPTPDEKITSILTQVALEIVSRVNAGRRKRGLSPASNTGLNVPPGAQRHAYALARRLMTDCFPSLAAYNGDDRKLSIDEAETFLDDLANNNADSDDAGGDAFIAASSNGPFSYGGRALLDFVSF